MTGGFSMYIKDNKLHYDYNYLDGVHYHLASKRLPRGETELKFNFIKTGGFAGTGELFVNGEKVGTVEMPKMHISTYSLAETFDVGLDTGTQVDRAYEGSPFPFNGVLDRVTITLTDT
jgi:arylsulfatase